MLVEQGVVTGDNFAQARNTQGQFATPGTPQFSGDANEFVSPRREDCRRCRCGLQTQSLVQRTNACYAGANLSGRLTREDFLPLSLRKDNLALAKKKASLRPSARKRLSNGFAKTSARR